MQKQLGSLRNSWQFVGAILFGVLFLWGADQQSRLVNTDAAAADQSAYMHYAAMLHQTHFTYEGPRSRMPLYPALVSLAYDSTIDSKSYFERGKRLNTILSMAVLFTCFVLVRQRAGILAAWTVTLVSGFTMLVYKAPFFQAEVLFYGLGLMFYLLAIDTIRQPGWIRAMFLGLVTALTYLTKATILPGLLAYLACLLMHAVLARSIRRQAVVCAVVTSITFLLALFPYLANNQTRFGAMFYNANSTFYMWYDSWEEVEQGVKSKGAAMQWPDVPRDELPSLRKYISEHTLGEIIDRLTGGLLKIWHTARRSYGYLPFVLFYGLSVVILMLSHSRTLLMALRRPDQATCALFVGCYFCGYLLLYAWFTPISSGNRFTLALFMPFLVTASWLLAAVQRRDLSMKVDRRHLMPHVVHYMVLAGLALYLCLVFPNRVGSMFGGS